MLILTIVFAGDFDWLISSRTALRNLEACLAKQFTVILHAQLYFKPCLFQNGWNRLWNQIVNAFFYLRSHRCILVNVAMETKALIIVVHKINKGE